MSFKVVVDYSVCQGHAQCSAYAPDIFEVDDHGMLTLLIEQPDESQRAAVLDAIDSCPTGALRIQE
ncbi:MAG: ferredoxin [Actinobacteria bacterium]|uniref:Unannotated protein n=1 Tax=freshwater metagenome TaxID=449393 RepID=A0A6J7RW19_9ZZZZ|nr:ferredoxin [Actinomycetota bacterium]